MIVHLLLALHHARAADATVTIRANNWIGSGEADWFSPTAWEGGEFLFADLPNPDLPTYFGPIEIIVNGLSTGEFLLSSGEAVLASLFSTPNLTMVASSTRTQIRLTPGGLLRTAAGIGGSPRNGYRPSGPFKPVVIVFDGGDIDGSWFFSQYSKVVFRQDYTINDRVWNGSVDGVDIHPGVILSLTHLGVSGAINNSGVITFDNIAPESPRVLNIIGPTVLHGAGTVFLNLSEVESGVPAGIIGLWGNILTNVDNVIRGHGQINVPFVNQGVIRAEGGTMRISHSQKFDNSVGTIEIAPDGVLFLRFFNFSDSGIGRLSIEPGGRIASGSELKNVQLIGPGSLVMPNGLSYLSGSIDNPGVIKIESAPGEGRVDVWVQGATVLKGAGSVLLQGESSHLDAAPTPGLEDHILTNVDNVIRGHGQINVPLVNQGVIRAEGGTLQISHTHQFDNSIGTIEIAPDGVLQLNSFTHHSDSGVGRLSIDPGGRIAAGSELHNVQLIGPSPLVTPSGLIRVSGTIENPGVIEIQSLLGQSLSVIWIVGPTFLQGAGSVNLIGPNSAIEPDPTGFQDDHLTNVDHVVRGHGRISVPLVNRGVIRAEAGTLEIRHNRQFDNSQGTLEVAPDGLLLLRDFTRSDSAIGPLSIEPGGQIAAGSELKDVQFIGKGPLVTPSGYIELSGIIDNPGIITFESAPDLGQSVIEIAGPTVLRGEGSVILNGSESSVITGELNRSDSHLTNADNSISGIGRIDAPFTNSGRIAPGQPQGTLTFGAPCNFTINSVIAIQIGRTEQGVESGLLRVESELSLSGQLEIYLGDHLSVEDLSGQFVIVNADTLRGDLLKKVGERFPTKNGLGTFLLTSPSDGLLALESFEANKLPLPEQLCVFHSSDGLRLVFGGNLNDWVIEGSSDLETWMPLDVFGHASLGKDESSVSIPLSVHPQFFFRLRAGQPGD